MADPKPDECPGNPANPGNLTLRDFLRFPELVLTEPKPISIVARQLAVARLEQYDRWWEAGAIGRPWIASGRNDNDPWQPLPPQSPVSARWQALRDADNERFLRDNALPLLLQAVTRLDLRVSGIGSRGKRVEIDSLLLPHLVFELEHDRARTADGSVGWLALEVAPAPGGQIGATLPARSASRQGDFLKWYSNAYPDGHPAGKKLETLAHEAAGALACRISTRTIRRALADRGQRTKAAR